MLPKLLQRMAFAAGLAAASVVPAMAQEGGFLPTGDSDGSYLIRLRGIAVVPDENVSVDQVDGASADISAAYVPELDLTYFFTENLAVELILATAPHDVDGTGAIDGADLGSVWLLPPTLTAQYHITQFSDTVKPYVGAGINYTIFYNVDDGDFESIEYDDTFGYALQAGVDIELDEGLYLNLDVKKVYLETDVTIDTGAGKLTGDVEINPWIFGAGVGFRF